MSLTGSGIGIVPTPGGGAAAPGGVQVHIFWGMGGWGSWGIGVCVGTIPIPDPVSDICN